MSFNFSSVKSSYELAFVDSYVAEPTVTTTALTGGTCTTPTQAYSGCGTISYSGVGTVAKARKRFF